MRKKRRAFIFLLLLLALTFNGIAAEATQHESKIVKSAAEYDYPPFSIVENGQADGFSVALLKAVCAEMGLDVEFDVGQWDVIKKQLEDRELDVLPLVGYSDERDVYFDFTVPYIVMKGNIFVRRGSTDIKSEADLYGKEIIVMRSDNAEEYARRMNFTDKLITVDTYSEAFQLLSEGSYDAVLAQSMVGLKLIKDLNITNVEVVTTLSDNGVDRIKLALEGYEQKFCFAVPEGEKALLAMLNEGLAIVSENGKYEELYLEWFPFLVEEKLDIKKMLMYVFIISSIILVSLLAFSLLMIRKEVARKTKTLEKNLLRNQIMFEALNQEHSTMAGRLDRALEDIIRITESQYGYIYLYDEEKKTFTLNSWSKEVMPECHIVDKQTVYELDKTGFWGEVVRQRKPIIVNEYNKPNHLKKGYPEGHVKFNRFMSIPILEDYRIVAVVGLANKAEDYDDHDLQQVTALMNGVWNIIERSLYRDRLEIEKNKYYSTLLSIGDAVMVVNLNHEIEMINKACIDMTGWSEKDAIGRPYQEVFVLQEEDKWHPVSDPVQKALKTGEPNKVSDYVAMTSKNGTKYLIENSASPIKNVDGEIIGAILVFRDVTDEQLHRKQIEYLSFHDALTGLYNRRFFEEEIRRLDTPRNYPLTLIMADLNGLKLTNDAFGHQEGDQLLKNTAWLLKKHLRAEDIAARWGGDEFAVIMPKTSYQDAAKIVDRIMSSGEKIKMSQGILSIAFGWETKTNENQTMDDIFKLAEEYMYRKKIIESQSVRGQTIKTIVKTLFEKSPREEGHSKRVSDLSVQIARILNLPPHIVSDIQTLGLLHDIGKIIVPSHILEKPDRLTSAEFSEIKKHPSIGYRMLTATSEFSGIAEGVLYHHERWDGQGYPEGLKGHQIPLQARIISIADAIDAMTFARPYRQKVMSDEEVREELLRCAGTQFDPEMIAKIIDSIIFPRWEKDLNQHTINKRQAEE